MVSDCRVEHGKTSRVAERKGRDGARSRQYRSVGCLKPAVAALGGVDSSEGCP